MHQLERVTNLLALLLTTRRHLTFEQIRQELAGQYPENLSAARAAFERDKAVLRDEGVPIDSEILGGDQAGSTGYRILKSAYELGDLGLTPQETAALRVAVGALRMGQTWAEEALWKIDLETEPGTASSPVVSATLPVDARLARVHEAISRRHPLRFVYAGRTRTLAPFGLLARHGKWYVVGEDVDIASERTFRLDRVEGDLAIVADTTFERPVGFDVRSSFPSDPKALPGAIDMGSDVARVRVDQSDVGVVIAHYGEEALVARLDDGSGLFDVPCSNVEAFRHWLLGFVERAEVLEPAALRDHIVAWLESFAGSARS